MNHLKHIVFLLLGILLITSCQDENRVKFEKPQPDKVKAIDNFGKEIQGVYVKFSNPNKRLIVHPDYIATNLTIQFKVGRFGLKIDSSAQIDLQNDSAVIRYFEQHGARATFQGDSIIYSQSIVDTIFYIEANQVLKKYKRNYFLNYQFDDHYWRVKKMKLRGDTLYFGEIYPDDSLLHYDYAAIDTNINEKHAKEYILSPSRREFKKLMRSRAFATTEKYIKQ
jgi:hypothetical protein